MLRDNVIVYDDGTPRTKHVTTNLAIEVDEDEGTAVSRSYFTVLQALPTWPYSRSSAAGISTASNAVTGSGVLSSGGFEPTSSAI